MTEFIAAIALIGILTFSSISGANQQTNTPQLTPATNSTCQIQTSIGCLDDEEITNYNVINNDGSICKVEIYGLCTDGMNQNELEWVANFYLKNKVN